MFLCLFLLNVYLVLYSGVPLQINFVTVGKETYLLEVPESLRGNIPRDYELRSSKKVSIKKDVVSKIIIARHCHLFDEVYTPALNFEQCKACPLYLFLFSTFRDSSGTGLQALRSS